MEYEIITTALFDEWRDSLKDPTIKRRIAARLSRLENGGFGDHKAMGNALHELRFFFGGGIRVYYTLRDGQIILLLAGGDKSSQSRDIVKARELLELE